MRAIIFDGPNRLRLAEVDAPRIEDSGDALVRVRLSGISGSNVRAFTGEWQRDPGNIIGFEYVGDIIETGSAVRHFHPGQRVIGPFSIHCGDCFYCKLGIYTACENRLGYGRQLSGTHAEFVRVPRADSMVEVVPDGVTDQQAVLATDSLPGPLAGLESAGLKPGESVVVLGAPTSSSNASAACRRWYRPSAWRGLVVASSVSATAGRATPNCRSATLPGSTSP